MVERRVVIGRLFRLTQLRTPAPLDDRISSAVSSCEASGLGLYDRWCVWGDSAFPYLFFIIKFLEAKGEQDRAGLLLVELFTILVETNEQRKGPVFPSPYLGVQEILAASIPDRLQDANLEAYRGSSFILRTALEMLVRRDRRDVVAACSAHPRRNERLRLCQADVELGGPGR